MAISINFVFMDFEKMFLIDTHYLIWDMAAHPIYSKKTEELFSEFEGQCYYSSISYWEIGMLIGKGRLKMNSSISQFFQDLERKSKIKALHITPEIGDYVKQFVHEINGDPADRILVATAMVHRAILVTADENLKSLSFIDTL